jgi:hypothetical protein
MKFKIDSVSQSKRLQRVLFSLGASWGGKESGKDIQHITLPYLYVDNEYGPWEITYSDKDSREFFYGNSNKLTDTETFISQHLEQGSSEHTNKQESKMKPHKHAELIKKWADGAEIEYQLISTGNWYSPEFPGWDVDTTYRVKSIPVRVFPVTSLTEDQLDDYVTHSGWHGGCIFTIAANAAIKQYILDTEK